MSRNFISGHRDQPVLLPPDMHEWLPVDHFVWTVIGAVDSADRQIFDAAYREDGQGRAAYDPMLLAAVMLYALSQGLRSSRQIERRCYEDIAMRVCAGGVLPDHATLARFRRRHAAALTSLFGHVLGLCCEAGLVDTALVAIDGTKIVADANRDRVGDLERIAAGALAEAERADNAEDAESPLQQAARRGRVLPPATDDDLPRTNKKRAQQRARARARKTNLTDPDSRIMRDRSAFVQGYNAQAAVSNDHVIVANDVSSDNGDNRLLEHMIDRTERELDAHDVSVGWYLADAGYWSGEPVERLRADGHRILVPPNGRPRGPGVPAAPPVARMQRRLTNHHNKRRFKRRQALVEPVFGHIKHNRGFKRLVLRRIEGARLEWSLACTVHNLKRLGTLPQPS